MADGETLENFGGKIRIKDFGVDWNKLKVAIKNKIDGALQRSGGAMTGALQVLPPVAPAEPVRKREYEADKAAMQAEIENSKDALNANHVLYVYEPSDAYVLPSDFNYLAIAIVFVNGVAQIPGEQYDFDMVTGEILFDESLRIGDVIYLVYNRKQAIPIDYMAISANGGDAEIDYQSISADGSANMVAAT